MAGKTGTAQVNYKDKSKLYYASSFVGYFPANEPKYSCIVVVHKPNVAAGYYGADVAGTLTIRPSVWALGLAIAVVGTLVSAGTRLWRIATMPLLEGSRPRLRRCSISARASGSLNRRSGRVMAKEEGTTRRQAGLRVAAGEQGPTRVGR